jgi:hypothetical protein
MQQVERHVRVSERRAGRVDGRATDVEIAHCEKLLRDLRWGIINLREFHSKDYDFAKQLTAQAAKIRRVEEKLLGLRQARLL